MQHLPLFADLMRRPCLVVGGGSVAERRVRQLLAAGAEVTVIAPEPNAPLAKLAAAGEVRLAATRFAPGSNLEPYWLVVAATDDPATNAEVAAAAEAAKRFCNVVDDPARSSFIMPAIIDRDPVTIAVASAGHSPVLARWLKGLIEAIVPARVGALALLAGRFREQVRDAIPNLDERRRFWEQALMGDTAEHALAGRDAESEWALEAALERWRSASAEPRGGEAYLVGAGPGSPDLITLRGRQLLAQAEVVLYDRLVNPAILEFARRDADLICVGKQARRPSITQTQLNRLLVQLVKSGKRVCRLKGGDPMVFGRVGEELEALTRAGLPFQIVPGVSAVEGCAAFAGIPLTLRGVAEAVLITTGHTQDHSSPDLAAYRPGQTLALYMGVAHFGAIADELIANGHDPATPVAIIENGTLDQQRVIRAALVDLARLSAEHGVKSPALLLVGETVRCAERYRWFDRGALVVAPEPASAKDAQAANL
ncbi:MAG TPA: siroheme synthase CysG [Gammaproteobacteria bacterium]|jgi:uroporphyrin-III C-methyltransferase/precorrin-2 dehydrogenase/sirohydrochlorin ferrochelatase